MERKQIYRFRKEEVKELTFRQLKVFSVIRQFSKDNKSNITIAEIMNRTKILKNHIHVEIKSLQEMNYLEKNGKDYTILKPIIAKEQFFFWEDKDLELKLTYNQFAVYCLLRTKSIQNGYAMLKQKTISELLGIDIHAVSKIVKQLIEKNLITVEKDKTYSRYYITENSTVLNRENSETEDVNEELTDAVEEIKPKTDAQELWDYCKWLFGFEADIKMKNRIKKFIKDNHCDEKEVLACLRFNQSDYLKSIDDMARKGYEVGKIFNVIIKVVEDKGYNELKQYRIKQENIKKELDRIGREMEQERLEREEREKKNPTTQIKKETKRNPYLDDPLFAELWEGF